MSQLARGKEPLRVRVAVYMASPMVCEWPNRDVRSCPGVRVKNREQKQFDSLLGCYIPEYTMQLWQA